jgi:hypothetical protein
MHKLFIIKTLVIFLLINFLTGCSPVNKYADDPDVLKWEPDIVKFEELDKTLSYPDDAIMFAGSSSIRLWSTLNEDMKPYNVIQRGFGGSKLSDFIVYADRIFVPHKSSALVFFVANDITGGENDKSPQEVRNLFSIVHRKFRKANPEAAVFYIAITPSRRRWEAWPQIMEGNRLVSDWCENQKNTWFIRTDTAFLNSSGEPREELFIDDKLHLNPDGYKIWTRIIKGELDRVLK